MKDCIYSRENWCEMYTKMNCAHCDAYRNRNKSTKTTYKEMKEREEPRMPKPKALCKEHGLHGAQAEKAAELMASRITTDILNIVNTFDTIPLYERITNYLLK